MLLQETACHQTIFLPFLGYCCSEATRRSGYEMDGGGADNVFLGKELCPDLTFTVSICIYSQMNHLLCQITAVLYSTGYLISPSYACMVLYTEMGNRSLTERHPILCKASRERGPNFSLWSWLWQVIIICSINTCLISTLNLSSFLFWRPVLEMSSDRLQSPPEFCISHFVKFLYTCNTDASFDHL